MNPPEIEESSARNFIDGLILFNIELFTIQTN
jgi:hypothetical protein